jgi:hypothetical protein
MPFIPNAQIQEVQGLPPQWTEGGDGSVVATIDGQANTPVTILSGSEAGTGGPRLFEVYTTATEQLGFYVDQSGSLFLGSDSGASLSVFAPVTSGIIASWRDVNGNVVGGVLRLGGLMVAAHAAPADGDLANGECALWFDQTDGIGNTKLMAKGKSADGTVKSATVAVLA